MTCANAELGNSRGKFRRCPPNRVSVYGCIGNVMRHFNKFHAALVTCLREGYLINWKARFYRPFVREILFPSVSDSQE